MRGALAGDPLILAASDEEELRKRYAAMVRVIIEDGRQVSGRNCRGNTKAPFTMSRTKKGSKAPGYEYWTNRPGNRGGAIPGKTSKRVTNRAERAEGKRCSAAGDGSLKEEK